MCKKKKNQTRWLNTGAKTRRLNTLVLKKKKKKRWLNTLVFVLCWGTVDAEFEVPSADDSELPKVSFMPGLVENIVFHASATARISTCLMCVFELRHPSPILPGSLQTKTDVECSALGSAPPLSSQAFEVTTMWSCGDWWNARKSDHHVVLWWLVECTMIRVWL